MQVARNNSGGLDKRLPSNDSLDYDLPNTRYTLAKILENTIEGIAIIGDDMRIEYVNDRVCEIIGRTREDLLGQSFLQFVHPDSTDLAEDRYANRLQGEAIPSAYEIKVLRNNDDSIDLHVHTTVLTNGEDAIKILAQVRDVTEDRRVRNSLSEYVTKYSTLIESMNEGLGVIDDKGTVIYANTALCKMLDYAEKELVGKTTSEVMYGLSFDEVLDKIKERIVGQTSRYETRLVHRSGRLIPVVTSASPLLGEDGEYQGSFAIFSDITTQKNTERALQTARNRSLLYLDMMGHDLRNHLQEIQVAAELLQYGVDKSLTSDLLERIIQAISKSSRIISETKTIDALSELPLRERPLDSVLEEITMAAITFYDDVEFNMSIQVSDAMIQADDYLELLLSDLISNACDSHLEGRKRVWIELRDGESTYKLIVSDNSSVLPSSAKRDLSDTSQRLGGLRLNLVHYIIEKYGGSFEIHDRMQDRRGHGTTVRLSFPKSS